MRKLLIQDVWSVAFRISSTRSFHASSTLHRKFEKYWDEEKPGYADKNAISPRDPEAETIHIPLLLTGKQFKEAFKMLKEDIVKRFNQIKLGPEPVEMHPQPGKYSVPFIRKIPDTALIPRSLFSHTQAKRQKCSTSPPPKT